MSAKQPVVLLIDGDIIAFTAASAAQHNFIDTFGWAYPMAHKAEGEAIAENILHGLRSMFDPVVGLKIVLSDPKDNWRWHIQGSYKANREGKARPLLLDYLKDYLREKHAAFHWESLEADDTLGILMTETKDYPEERILIGRDKDFKTIPGKYHRIKDMQNGKPVILESTKWEATRFHLMQILAGDRVDGYPGCPGIGMERAERIIADPQLLVPQPGVITRGVNKGNSTTKWVAEPTRDYWACIVSNYKKAGGSEKDALFTARMSHILHDEDYDRETRTVRLWTPEKLKGI